MRLVRTILATITAASVLLAVLPSQAAQQSARYIAGQGLRPRNVPDHTGVLTDNVGRAGLMGYNFVMPASHKLTRIRVIDDIVGGDDIGVLYWFEETPGDQYGGCTDANGNLNVPISPTGGLVRVNVQNYETGQLWLGSEPCNNVATTGTITITHS